jgi:hypothetical protein
VAFTKYVDGYETVDAAERIYRKIS